MKRLRRQPGGRRLAYGALGLVLLVGLADAPTLGSASTGRLHPSHVDALKSTASAITAGRFHTCAVTSDGGVKCWGANFSHQLGDGATRSRTVPTAVHALPGGVRAVTAGALHTCALSESGAVRCWGANFDGQLGDGTTKPRSVPVTVVGLESGVVAIAAGGNHTCAVTTGGEVMCWGADFKIGTRTNSLTPVRIRPLPENVVAVSSGPYHTCALTSGGGVECWGRNNDGQLGEGDTQAESSLVAVVGLDQGVRAIAVGGSHTCALTASGAVKCWGANHEGQLGNGTKKSRFTPGQVSRLMSGVSAIAAGEEHTCAIASSGRVECWGANFGTAPVRVDGLADGATAIAAGADHTCAITSVGSVVCWGQNANGELGDGTKQASDTPTSVAGLSAPPPQPVATATGTVLISGSPFTSGPVPYGKPVDVTNGTLKLTTRAGTIEVYGGGVTAIFVLRKGSEHGKPLDILVLIGGDFSVCGKSRRHVVLNSPVLLDKKHPPRKRNRKTVRRLWSKAKGHFRVKGKYSYATVRGTMWLVADRCDGTLTSVTRGRVEVYDVVRRKRVSVRSGHSYVVRPRR